MIVFASLILGLLFRIPPTAPADASGAGSREPARVAAGTWGGQGIAMEVTDKGATVEYDCAHGTVDQGMTLDGNGKFDARGNHVKEHPGPIREGESAGAPARYSGNLDGDTMTLTVKLIGTDEVVGTFRLVFGKPGRIHKCS